MADIPRFYAQVGQISVPRMRDYGYEQNVSIYKTLKAAGERIDNTFFEIVAEGQLGQPSTKPNDTYYKLYNEGIDIAGSKQNG